MARVLIQEPHPEVRDLLDRIMGRLGHHAVHDHATLDIAEVEVDVLLVEPAAEGAVARAATIAEATGAALVFVSICPPSEEALALNPVAYLLKPFSLVELEHAIGAALGEARPAYQPV